MTLGRRRPLPSAHPCIAAVVEATGLDRHTVLGVWVEFAVWFRRRAERPDAAGVREVMGSDLPDRLRIDIGRDELFWVEAQIAGWFYWTHDGLACDADSARPFSL